MAVPLQLDARSRFEMTPFAIACGVTVVAFALLLVVGAATRWFDVPPETIVDHRSGLVLDPEYCEAIGAGFVRTIANSWSNLGYLGAGLGVVYLAQRASRGADLGTTSPADHPFFSSLYAAAVILTGLFSFAFHASRTEFGKVLDVLGMYAWAAAVPAYVLGAWLHVAGTPVRAFVVALAAQVSFTALAGAARFWWKLPSELGLVGLPALGLVLQSIRIWGWPGRLLGLVARRWRTLSWRQVDHRAWGVWTLLASLAVLALAAWIREVSMSALGKDGAVAYTALCDPRNAVFAPQDHLIQGHAIWHVMSAGTFLLLYLFFRSEQPATA